MYGTCLRHVLRRFIFGDLMYANHSRNSCELSMRVGYLYSHMPAVIMKLALLVQIAVAAVPESPSPIDIPDYKDVEKSYKNDFIDGSLALLPTSSGPRLTMGMPKTIDKKSCQKETVSALTLFRNGGRLSSGSIKLSGRDAQVEYIYLGMESPFIYMPPSEYNAFIKNIDETYIKNTPKGPIIFDAKLLQSLPSIQVQFSNTHSMYTIQPVAFTKCEAAKPEGNPQKCLLLVKRAFEFTHWVLGRPFLDHVVSSVSIGDTSPFYKICVAESTDESKFVTYNHSDHSVSTPWTMNDYLMIVGLVLFILFLFLYFFAHKLPCFKRPRRATADILADTPAAPAGETQPLINPATPMDNHA